ncbi:hypothetical protein Blastoid_60 [Bacillus phage Blastoid]|uniref:Uncharacterized protein n=1 Tax=Bacillus phage Blastoid TaxID=2880540 RepID=U5PSJ0_9CAUD|nr:hypothetical protein V456_gp60 [Bacillus phage Blastoid]AGY46859.1 hypothetical protein Blastoid_60 [Bacillus phage Blastoid]
MSTIRKVVVTPEQGKAINMMFENANKYNRDQLQIREYMTNCIVTGHGGWKDDYKSLNKMHLSDLLYIVTGGAWEIQKTVRSVIEDLRDKFKRDSMSFEETALLMTLEELEKEGLI